MGIEVVCAGRLSHGQLGEPELGTEGWNFPSHERGSSSRGRGWGCPEEELASGDSAFFPQAPGVPITLSLYPFISSPLPGRISQCVASFPRVSEEPLRDGVGIPSCKGDGHSNVRRGSPGRKGQQKAFFVSSVHSIEAQWLRPRFPWVWIPALLFN